MGKVHNGDTFVCVCVTAGGVRAQRGPGGSRRDVDRSRCLGLRC
jgi:hypothetical protein